MTLAKRCDLLRSLHVPGDPLVLPNAWDAVSARAVEAAGFAVVATTSAGVAEALGHEDHEEAPVEEMLAAARRIVRAVDVPVTVDFEAGYGLEPNELVEALVGIGAAGCNLEDTDHKTGALRDQAEHARTLAAVRNAAATRDYPLVVNARVDVFILDRDGRPQLELVEEGVARGKAYLEAGAECVYPILLQEGEAIAELVGRVDGPVNVLASPSVPPLAELARLGVARVSHGPFVFRRLVKQLEAWLAEERPDRP
jgi:2-methylisocitrate lyase-like PEP mutase family enzyme